MGRLVSLLFVSLLLGGIWFSDASGRIWTASPDGSEGDGILALILEQAAEADTIRLLAGTHDWPGLVGLSLSIQGEKGASIRGGTVGAQDISWFEFDGIDFEPGGSILVSRARRFTMSNCGYREAGAPVWVVRVDSVFVSDCEFTDNVPVDQHDPGALLIGLLEHLEITNCLFARNRTQAGSPIHEGGGRGGGAVSVVNCSNAVILGNVFRENEAVSGSALEYQGGPITLEENTFYRNTCQAAAVLINIWNPASEGGFVRQNIFVENAGYGLAFGIESVPPPRVYCNAFWGNHDIFPVCSWDEGQWWSCVTPLGYEGLRDYYSVIADPMFCSDDSLFVSKDSPIAAPPGEPCEAIGGALGFGCGVDPVITTSWGAVKQLFKKGN